MLREEGWQPLDAAMRSKPCLIGAPTLFEFRRVLSARGFRTAGAIVEELLTGDLSVSPFGEPHYRLAEEAFERFGKGVGGGSEASVLTIFDCMTYAAARHARLPLLFKGDDFQHTDLKLHPASKDGRGRTIGKRR
jgi:ribonuclease VapC